MKETLNGSLIDQTTISLYYAMNGVIQCAQYLYYCVIFTQQSIVGGKQLFHWHVLAALCPLPLYDYTFIWQQTGFTDKSLLCLMTIMIFDDAPCLCARHKHTCTWTFCSQVVILIVHSDRHSTCLCAGVVYVIHEVIVLFPKPFSH